MNVEDLAIVSASILVVVIFSQLIKTNWASRLGEFLLIGGSTGYYAGVGLRRIWENGIELAVVQGEWILWPAIILGIFILFRWHPATARWGRTGIAVQVGLGLGAMSAGIAKSDITSQLAATFTQVATLDEIIVIIGVATSIFFFVFAIEHTGILRYLGMIGRWFIMCTFGALFATMIMGRASAAMGVLQDYPLSPMGLTYGVPIGLVIVAISLLYPYFTRK
jgi:hypothetical protein